MEETKKSGLEVEVVLVTVTIDITQDHLVEDIVHDHHVEDIVHDHHDELPCDSGITINATLYNSKQ